MNVVLLSGGSGKRLWPLSNEVRSKQFLKIFKKPDGSHESMLQRMYWFLNNMSQQTNITVATSQKQVSVIHSQIGNAVGISVEPCRKDTFPAIALATAYLHDIQNISRENAIVICPVDIYVESSYFSTLQELQELAQSGEGNVILMGIEPTYPSEKYGYIIPNDKSRISTVKVFKEKPDVLKAKNYISQGAIWNSGVSAFKIDYLLQKSKDLLGTDKHAELFENYDKLPKVSLDHAVLEKEDNIKVIRYVGTWEDLGTWNTLTDAMSDEIAGNAVAPLSTNTHVINELQIPLIALGTNNLAIVATPDGILVTDKEQSAQLKDYVSDNRPMYEKRLWGEYKVLDYQITPQLNKNTNNVENSLTKHLIIKKGQHISYQIHKHRSEIWTFISGKGLLIIDNNTRNVTRGDIAYIKPGMKHAIEAIDGDLHIIEVQIGDELTEDDIERLEWPVKLLEHTKINFDTYSSN